MPDLTKMDIRIVALVGKAANKRKFLVVKNEAGRKETVVNPPTPAPVVPPAAAPAVVKSEAAPVVEPQDGNLTAVMKSVAQTRSMVQWAASALSIAKASRGGKPALRDHGRFKKVTA